MTNVTVVGLGLMGASLAGALKNNGGFSVAGVDTNPEAVDSALEKGLIDKGMDSFDANEKADILFLCMYPEGILSFIRKHKNEIGADTIVTDISGIQGELCRRIESEAQGICRIGGHPLCGAAGRGHEKAQPAFFSGASYILIDSSGKWKEKIEKLKGVLLAAGIGEISIMTPEEHDRRIAVVSHLPHLISSAFITAFDRRDFRVHGGSFKDMVRIADINPDLWTQIIKNNKMYVTEVLEDFIENLGELQEHIEKDAYGRVHGFFEKTYETKRSLESNENL